MMRIGRAYVSGFDVFNYYAMLISVKDVECNRYNGKKGQGMFVKKPKKKAEVCSIPCPVQ